MSWNAHLMSRPGREREMNWKRLATPEIAVILALIPIAAGAGLWTGRWEVAALVMVFSAATGCPGCAVSAILRRGDACPPSRPTPPPGI